MSTVDMDLIVVEILPRLPVKSLIRFKCVSKYFKAAISSRGFAKVYLRYQSLLSDANDLLILPGNSRINCYDLDSHPLSPATTTFAWFVRGSVSVVGSSNGLLCTIFTPSGSTSHLSVLNLSTRITQHIPIQEQRGYNLGFAFDHVNLDYKIVIVFDHHTRSAIKTRITKVYSMNTNSWGIIETAPPTDSIETSHGGVLINDNLLHWKFWSPSLYKRRIGCFDVCKNEWTDDVLLPHHYYNPIYKKYLLDFGVLDDQLFSSFQNRDETCFDVWVMKEYGVQDSWFKLLSIPISNDLGDGLIPVAYRGVSDNGNGDDNGEILIRQRHSSRLYWYNRTNNGMREAMFRGAPNFSELQVYMCSRSRVDLPGGTLFGDPEVPSELSGRSVNARIKKMIHRRVMRRME